VLFLDQHSPGLPDDLCRGYSFSGLSAAPAFNTKHKANASATATAAELELISDSFEGALAGKMAIRGKLTSRRPRSGHWMLFFMCEESWLCFSRFFSGR
jgi:hypothetical protein